MRIRSLKNKDIPEIIKIGRKVKEFYISPVSRFWTREELISLSKSKEDVCLIAETDKIVGFAICTSHKPTRTAALEDIWINQNHRGEGVGGKMIKELARQLRKKKYTYLCGFTLVSNKHKDFFKKYGFTLGEKGYWFDRDLS